MYRLDENLKKIRQKGKPGQLMEPLWQSSPANADTVRVNLFSDPCIMRLFQTNMDVKHTVMSPETKIGNLFDWMFDDNEKDCKG